MKSIKSRRPRLDSFFGLMCGTSARFKPLRSAVAPEVGLIRHLPVKAQIGSAGIAESEAYVVQNLLDWEHFDLSTRISESSSCVGGRLTRRVAGQPLLARLQEFLRS